MDALDLLHRLYRAGVVITIVDGDNLKISGRPISDTMKAELIAHKPDVLAILREHHVGDRSPNPEIEMPIRFVVPCDNVVCPHLGPCRWYLESGSCAFTERMEGAA